MRALFIRKNESIETLEKAEALAPHSCMVIEVINGWWAFDTVDDYDIWLAYKEDYKVSTCSSHQHVHRINRLETFDYQGDRLETFDYPLHYNK